MKATEAAALLTIAAAYDNRKPDADQAKAWAMALDGLRFEDCRDVIVQHYQHSKEWLMPFDIITRVKRLRAKRIHDAPPPTPPSWLDPDDPQALIRWQCETDKAIADGTYRPEEPAAIGGRDVIRELGQAMPVSAALADHNPREAIRKAKEVLQAAAAEKKRARDERQAELEAMRKADRDARATTPAVDTTRDTKATNHTEETS